MRNDPTNVLHPVADGVLVWLQPGGETGVAAVQMVSAPEVAPNLAAAARLIAEGHDKVNFAIVAAGENAASPHHHPGDRVIRQGEIVLCDFGGTMNGYCSDITRCVHLGTPPAEVADAVAGAGVGDARRFVAERQFDVEFARVFEHEMQVLAQVRQRRRRECRRRGDEPEAGRQSDGRNERGRVLSSFRFAIGRL